MENKKMDSGMLERDIFQAIFEFKESMKNEEVEAKTRNMEMYYGEEEAWAFEWEEMYEMRCDKLNSTKLITPSQNFSIPMDKHHIDPYTLVYIPRMVHRAVYHKRGDGKLEGVIG